MKKVFAAALVTTMMAAAVLSGCGKQEAQPTEAATEAAAEETEAAAEETEAPAEETEAETEAQAEAELPEFSYTGEDPYVPVIWDYMKEKFVPGYDPCDISLPAYVIVRVDDSDPEDIKVWGRFWIDNYALKGTTLMSRSGGSYPGCFHLKKAGDSFEVVSFDEVESGADSGPSEKRIFGIDEELMEAYLTSEKDITDSRCSSAHMYSEETGVPIEMIQDYGWDPFQVVFDKDDYVIVYPDIKGDWETEDGKAFMTIDLTDMGSTYDIMIEADQPDDTTLTYDLYGQYEMSTNTLYYWNGFISQDGKDIENNGIGEEGSLALSEDGSITWVDGDKEPVVFNKAKD